MTKTRPTILLDDMMHAIDHSLNEYKPEGHRKDVIEDWLMLCLEFGMTGNLVVKDVAKPFKVWKAVRAHMQTDLRALHTGAPLVDTTEHRRRSVRARLGVNR